MKKSKLIFMAGIMSAVVLFAGCGGESKDVNGTVVALETTAEATVEDKVVSLGRMEGGSYTNEYVGYGCFLDENWQFYTAEELQELPSAKEMLEGSELSEAISDLPQFQDMMAENVEDMTGMNVFYTQISMQERLAQAMLSEEELVDTTLDQKDMVEEGFAQAGIELSSMEKVIVTFLGEERTAIHSTASIQGIPYYTLQLFDHNLGEYYVTLTLYSYMEDKTESLLDLFYEVE